MNRHWKDGFQTNFTNDLYNVEAQLKAYDEHLYLMFNPHNGQWLIMDGLLELAVMRIPQMGFETLDSRVVDHIKKIHTKNGYRASWEIKEADERRERENKRKMDDLAYNYAKDMERPVKELAYYGRT